VLVLEGRQPFRHRGRACIALRFGHRRRAQRAQARRRQEGGRRLARKCFHEAHHDRLDLRALSSGRTATVRGLRRRPCCGGGGALAQPRRESAGQLPDHRGPLAPEPVEGRGVHAQQETVADRPDAGGAWIAGEHADLPDRLAGRHLRHQAGAGSRDSIHTCSRPRASR
jgi:hypothetical protein